VKFDRKDLLACAVLWALVIAFFFEVIFSSKTFTGGESISTFYALRKFLAENLQRGNLPLWNPHSFLGQPFLTDLKAALFYPFNFFFFLKDSAGVFQWVVIGHYFMAAIFMYLLMRRLGRFVLSAMFAAIVFTFSGYFIAQQSHLQNLSGGVWMPLILLFYHFSVERVDYRLASLCGFFLAIQFFSGDLFNVFWTLLILMAWGLWANSKEIPALQKGKIFGVSLLVFLGVAMVQLLPLIEWVFYTRPAHSSWSSLNIKPFSVVRFFEMIFPFLFGSTPESKGFWGGFLIQEGAWVWGPQGIYMGILPLSFIPIALLAGKKRLVSVFLGICGISLFFVFLSSFSFLPLLQKIFPLWGYFWQPEKFVFFTTFSLAALAGLGLEAFLNICQNTGFVGVSGHRKIKIYIRILFGLTVVFWLGIVLFLLNKENLSAWFASLGSDPQTNPYFQVFFCLLFGTVLITACAFLLFKRFQIRGDEKFFATLVMVICIWELFQVNGKLNDFGPLPDWGANASVVKLLPQENKPFRIFRDERLDRGKDSNPFFTLGGKTHLFSHLDVFSLPLEDEFANVASPSESSLIQTFTSQEILPHFLRNWNVHYLLMPQRFAGFIPDEKKSLFSKINEIPELKLSLWHVKDPRPRAWAVFDWEYFDSSAWPVGKMGVSPYLGRFSPLQFPYSEKALIHLQSGKSKVTPPVESLSKNPHDFVMIELQEAGTDYLEFVVQSKYPGFLVLANAYYPGWGLTMDNQREGLFRVNGDLLGCFIRAGIQKVRFEFVPWTYRWGKYFTFASLMALVVYLFHPFSLKTILHAFSLVGLRRDEEPLD
jgi:hypothetical protein